MCDIYLVMLMVFACEHVQKRRRPMMSMARSNGCECEPEPPIKSVGFVPFSRDFLTDPRPSICEI